MFKLFSVDDHIIEHGTVWTDRAPKKYLDLVPHVVEEDGQETWIIEGKPGKASSLGLNAVAGMPRDDWKPDEGPGEPQRFDQMIQGCWDPAERAKDFLSDGILASIGFPSLPRFGGMLFNEFDDKQLADVCVQAYNDFVIDEWCPGGPEGMYVPMIIGHVWDPQACAAEIRRCASKGNRAISLPENGVPAGLPSFWSDYWDPIWDACQETDTVVCMHLGSQGRVPKPSPDGPAVIGIVACIANTMVAAINLMLAPTCRNFPGLKIVFSEGGIGWVPAAIERADRQVIRHRSWAGIPDPLPSEIFRRNMWVCTIEEPVGIKYRHDIGVDKILWESDYPHADTPWPFAQKGAAEVFADVPQDEVDLITHRNAENLFRWKITDPSLATVGDAQAA
jgi:predicted TIM-barrel fold metal-dependent hydrolase